MAAGAVATTVLLVLGTVLLTPLFSLSLLFGPILVAEECNAWKALRLWCRLLRRHLGRLLAYQILAVGIGLLITLPSVLPLFPLPFLPLDERLTRAWAFCRDVLAGMASAPLLAYLTVANLFIYLNLSYGTVERRRR
jgi:hypothetical protein